MDKDTDSPIASGPIFVDLDGTLVRTDLFVESLLRFLKANPLNIFRLFTWILASRALAKERIAERVEIDVENLPFETTLIDYLKQQKREGRSIILATASHCHYAQQVATHLRIFDQVMATQDGSNLKGSRKLAAIRTIVGDDAFTYAGDNASDRPIWRAATGNILVNAPGRDVAAARASNKVALIIQSRPPLWRAFLQEMRLHQYAKNALIFVPLFTSHSYQGPSILITAALAFVCFSLCASGVYFLNDLLDLQSDRQHASKRGRPLASGALPVSVGIAGAVALPVIAFYLALALLPILFTIVMAFYFVITNAYSFILKRISTADVITLAVLYTLRIVAGAAAMGIALSGWLMAFSMFLFVSLAFLKRYTEVMALPDDDAKAHGRGYTAADRETMFSLGTANIMASVLILALYINSTEVTILYQTPEILWLLCLLMLYWGNRIWVGARRGKIDDDPIVFAIKDNVSRIVGCLFIITALLARHVQIPPIQN